MKKIRLELTGVVAAVAVAVAFICAGCNDNGVANGDGEAGGFLYRFYGGASSGNGGGGYDYVDLGGNKWMKKNLDIKTANSWCYGEGGQVQVADAADIDTLTSSQIEANCAKYGRLYTWAAAKNACPTGWHLPTNKDWDELVTATYSWSEAGKKLKSANGWNDYCLEWGDGSCKRSVSGNGTDEFKFSALPGGSGDRSYDGTTGQFVGYFFYGVGEYGYWWTATEISEGGSGADALVMYNNDGEVHSGEHYKDNMKSVRCVMNQ
jgi:uncharacterized protein (TIGR02145 family)